MAGTKGSKYYDIFLKYTAWLEKGDRTVISPEGFLILKEIDTLGSLMAASEKVGLSYRKAWGVVKETENLLGFKLTEKMRGGKDGGKTILTPEGKNLLNAYYQLTVEMDNAIHNVTKNFFRTINK